MEIVNAAYLIAAETGHGGLIHRWHVTARRLRRRPNAINIIINIMYKKKCQLSKMTKVKTTTIYYLGTPRNGSGVTDELRTTPEVFAGAGDTMLLG